MFAPRPLARAGLAAGLLLVLGIAALAQRQLIPTPPPADPAPANEFVLPTDARFEAVLDAIDDCVKAELWVEATSALGKVLDHPRGDVMVIRKTGAVTRMVSARATAFQVIAGLPKAGRDAYEMNRGPMAAALLKEADRLNPERLAEVVRRFPFTRAGGEALEALGALHFDRGGYSEAARCYELLQEQLPLDKWSDAAVYRATLALHRAGKKAAALEKELRGRIGEKGIKVGERNVTAKDLDKELAEQPDKKDTRDWQIFGGSPARTEAGTGSAPHLMPRFKIATVREEASKALLEQLRPQAVARGWPAISGATPLVVMIPVGNKPALHVLYRSWWGVHAVGVANKELLWEAPLDSSLDRMIRDVRLVNSVQSWVAMYQQQYQRPTIFWENSQAGSLSATDQHVFVVDDLPVPPALNRAAGFPELNLPQALKERIEGNRLQGFQLRSGKLTWEVGGPNDKGDLKQSYFLGPPLPLDGRLYALNEKNQELRLVTLEPASGKVLGLQGLGSTASSFLDNPLRRIQAVHLSSSGGILVIPTGAGALLGYDLLQGRLAWAHAYREPPAAPVVPPNPFRRPPFPGQVAALTPAIPLLGNTAPYIAAGKVVFQPAEGRTVYCLDLRDGSLVWKQPLREDDVYVGGVTRDLVLVVGKRSCRALSLNQGQVAWTLDTGLPSGQGQVVDGTYYLPLKESAQNKDPEVCSIDLAKGRIIAHIRGANKDVPGNLLFRDGFVVSQTPTELAIFPQLAAVLEEIDARLKKNADDPVGLLTRAELRLDKGDLKGAVEDLRKARDGKPDAAVLKRIRTRLYEALTELLKRDFPAGEPFLKEYEELLDDQEKTPEGQQEERRRRAQFHMLAARGLAQQGKPVEALEHAFRLAGLTETAELLPSIDEPGLRVTGPVWAREFVTRLLAGAAPGPRKQLDEAIAGKWKKVEKAKDPAELRGFVNLLGVGTAEGREAHLLLAEVRGKEKAYREADVLLQKVRARKEDAGRAARALAALAALATEQALLPDAVHYARHLKELYPNTPIGDGKKGSDVYDAMSTDKRFLPFLEEKPFPAAKLKATEEQGNFLFQQVGYRFRQAGEALPFFTRNALLFRLNTQQFRVVDVKTGEERWSAMLGQTLLSQILSLDIAQVRTPPTLSTVGHLVVLPAGNLVFGIDPVEKKVLWQVSLHSPFAQQAAPPAVASVTIDPRDGGVHLLYPDGWLQTVGQVLPEADAVVLETREGLVAVDPLTGAVLWHRAGLGQRLRIFGDGEHLAVVELNGDGTATATRLLRLADGSAVKAADFSALYGSRLRELGCTLLVGSVLPNGGQLLRRYDVLTGKDLWRQETPAGTLLLGGDDPDLVGWIEPGGKVRVVSLSDRKKVLEAEIDAKALEKVLSGRLVLDRDNVYLLITRPSEGARILGVPAPVTFPQTGFHSVPVNGDVFAFHGATGQLRWSVPVENQNLLLTRLDESPLLLFTTRYTETQTAGIARVRQVTSVKAVSKRTGKLLYDRTDLMPGSSFFDLRIDPKEGIVELIGTSLKVRFAAE
jgi:outer membrane protein assembly factor BamB/tetratricopeptide (TPR) repeat protein